MTRHLISNWIKRSSVHSAFICLTLLSTISSAESSYFRRKPIWRPFFTFGKCNEAEHHARARARTNCGSSTMNNNRESIKQKTKKKSLLEATLNLLKLQRLPTVTAIWAEQFFPVSHAVTKFKWIPGIQTTRVIARVQLSAHTICSCCQIATLTANKHTYKTQNTHYARSSNVSPKRCVDDDGWLTSTALRWIVVDNLNRSFHFFFVAVRLAACGRDSQQGSAAG